MTTWAEPTDRLAAAMVPDSTQRLIVSCDDCGTPFPAVTDGEGEPAVVGQDGAGCPSCGSDSFSRIKF